MNIWEVRLSPGLKSRICMTQKTVLIIDDDNDLTEVLSHKLAAEGFRTIVAHDGREGLTVALNDHPDLVLLDIIMPVMDGWEALDKLRADTWGLQVPVIMLTNVEDIDNVSAALERGSYDYLVKTQWNLDDVVEKIKQRLSGP